jgi:hypothetical protein
VFERSHQDSDPVAKSFFADFDRAKLDEIAAASIPYWYPALSLSEHIPYRMLYKQDFRPSEAQTLADLFTKRNLWAMAALYEHSKRMGGSGKSLLLFSLNSIAMALSRLQGYVEDPRFPNQLLRGTYYIPLVGREYNAKVWLGGKMKNMVAGYSYLRSQVLSRRVIVSTQSACDLTKIPANSVDYIFTDPPYGENVQYGELNFLWEAWCQFDLSWRSDEIVVSPIRDKTESEWASRMRLAFGECFRVLKFGRWLSLCYHDTSEGTWSLVQDIMAEVGFIADDSETALFIDTKQKSFNQLNADKVTKRDLVVNFRKPKVGELQKGICITGDEEPPVFASKVRELIAEFLTSTPGATKDRIYDHVVSRMVRSGTMQAHNFEEYLRQIAEPVCEAVKKNLFEDKEPDLFGSHEIVRWYLTSTQLDVVDAAESAKEDRAAEVVRTLIEAKIKASPWIDGVHYSDIFEHFIYAVHDKPRRPMAEWLLDYFFKTESGTYRPPATDAEAKIKTDGRSQGTSRRIRRYLAFLEQGVAIPAREQQTDSTLSDWIRHAKLSGMYDAGKMLFERGGLSLDRLSEEAAVNVEEDYQVCVRMLSRQEKK